MLPFSSEAVFVFQAAAFFSLCCLLFWRAQKARWYAAVPVIAVCAFGIVYLGGSKGGYEGMGRLFLVAFACVMVVVSGIWTALFAYFARRRSWNNNTLWLILTAPALLASGAAAVSQYTPPSDCAQDRMTITIGAQAYTLEKSYHAMVRLPKRAPEESSQFAYTPLRKDKLDLRALCKRARGSAGPVVVEDLWLRAENVISGTTLDWRDMESMKIVKRDKYFADPYDSPSKMIQNIAELKQREGFLAQGDDYDGHVCRENLYQRSGDHYCLAWRSVEADTIIVGTMFERGGMSYAQTLALLNSNMDSALARLTQ